MSKFITQRGISYMKIPLTIAIITLIFFSTPNEASAQNQCIQNAYVNSNYTPIRNGCRGDITMWYYGGTIGCQSGRSGLVYPCMTRIGGGQTINVNVQRGYTFWYVTCFTSDLKSGRCRGPN